MTGVVLCGDRTADAAATQGTVGGLRIGDHSVAGVFIKRLITRGASLMRATPHTE